MAFVGGYVLFPLTSNWPDLLTATLQAMELNPGEIDVRLSDPDEDAGPSSFESWFPTRVEQPVERALELLAQEKSGVIDGEGEREFEKYWYEPMITPHPYPLLNIWVNDASMFYDPNARRVEAFARRWPQLCEQGQAVFGYFSPFEFMFDREYLEEKILPAFQHGTVREFLEQITPSWLIYLGPELAERWRQEQQPLPSPLLLSQDLPSGAHFVRASLGVSEASLSTFRPW